MHRTPWWIRFLESKESKVKGPNRLANIIRVRACFWMSLSFGVLPTERRVAKRRDPFAVENESQGGIPPATIEE
jgi:hypothetical protein